MSTLSFPFREQLSQASAYGIRAGCYPIEVSRAAYACYTSRSELDLKTGESIQDPARLPTVLRDRHAFDRGDEKLLGRVEKMRDSLGRRLEDMADPFARLERFSLESTTGCASAFAEPLATVESADVTEAQAADVAARLAAAIYEREGLHGVVKRFGYVVFNGARVTERNAEGHLRRWNAMGN